LRWLVLFLTAICLTFGAFAQSSGYSSSELDTLVGPIALYPDPLLNSIVAGAAYPDQIKAAAQAGGKNPKSDWDTAVMALCDYPDVLTMMNKNTDWTQAIGWAGVNQGQDLMDAVQRFRFQAQSAGNLKTDDKMEVIEEGSTIRIEPANPQIVYVPSYQPQTVVIQNDYDDDVAAGVIGFGVGIATSALLYNNYWHGGAWYHPPGGWYGGGGWNGGAGWNAYSPRTNINRPVNINNINTGNINIGNRNNIGNGNRNNIGNGNGIKNNGNRPNNGINGGNRPNNGMGNRPNGGANRPAVTPSQRPTVRPNVPSQRPAFSSARPNFQAPNMGNYQRPSGGGGFNSGNFQRPSGGGGFNSGNFQRSGGGNFQRPQNTNFNRSGMSGYSRSGSANRESSRGAQSRGTRSYSGGGGGHRGGGGGGRRR